MLAEEIFEYKNTIISHETKINRLKYIRFRKIFLRLFYILSKFLQYNCDKLQIRTMFHSLCEDISRMFICYNPFNSGLHFAFRIMTTETSKNYALFLFYSFYFPVAQLYCRPNIFSWFIAENLADPLLQAAFNSGNISIIANDNDFSRCVAFL